MYLKAQRLYFDALVLAASRGRNTMWFQNFTVFHQLQLFPSLLACIEGSLPSITIRNRVSLVLTSSTIDLISLIVHRLLSSIIGASSDKISTS